MSVTDAKARLSELIAYVEHGEDVQITKNGKPAVRIVLDGQRAEKVRQFGLSPNGWIAEDFDAPLPDGELALWE